jgi:hypothetical protein
MPASSSSRHSGCCTRTQASSVSCAGCGLAGELEGKGVVERPMAWLQARPKLPTRVRF